MYLSIIFFPLFSSIVAGLFGRFLGGKGSCLITTIGVGLSLFLSCVVFIEVGFYCCPTYIKMSTWFDIDFLNISWSFCFDSLTVVMLFVVTFISSLVHIYSLEYMQHDSHLTRFMSYLSLFTFFMLILITADNFIQMFVGWEGVGLCSYLLINFWFSRLQANKAAIKAMLVNRVGDFGLVLSILGISICFGAVDYGTVFSLVPQYSYFEFSLFSYNIKALNVIGILLFIGAAGKSAQIGLHTWLPDAMEGPTPVSALIHAATMVTAGVFILVRSSPLLEFSPDALYWVTIIGGMTSFFGATTALVQNDLKRVVAYSTCSQLGYMVFACGVSNYNVAIYHLANHAFFKALLFLAAGSVIHAIKGEQDLRKMGGLRRLLPFTYAMMIIGSFSLMGIPFLSGFYSKDVILEVTYATYTKASFFAYLLGTFAVFFTSFYSIRLLALCFLVEPNGDRVVLLKASESGWLMSSPLAILAIPSIFSGYLCKDLFIGLGTGFWGNSIFILPSNLSIVDGEFLPKYIKLFPTILSILGGYSSFILYCRYQETLFLVKKSRIGRLLYEFLNRKWFFDKVQNDIISQSVLDLSNDFSVECIDRGFIEFLGPSGLTDLCHDYSKKIRKFQTGHVFHYSMPLVLFSVLIFICLNPYLFTAFGMYSNTWRLFPLFYLLQLFFGFCSFVVDIVFIFYYNLFYFFPFLALVIPVLFYIYLKKSLNICK